MFLLFGGPGFCLILFLRNLHFYFYVGYTIYTATKKMNNDSSFLRPLSIFVSENFPGNIIDTSVRWNLKVLISLSDS